jgi:hypothetical protein
LGFFLSDIQRKRLTLAERMGGLPEIMGNQVKQRRGEARGYLINRDGKARGYLGQRRREARAYLIHGRWESKWC